MVNVVVEPLVALGPTGARSTNQLQLLIRRVVPFALIVFYQRVGRPLINRLHGFSNLET